MYFKTMTQLVTDLQVRVRDTAPSRWSAAEHRAALVGSCRRLGAIGYAVPSVYDGLTLAANTYGYALPDRVQNIYAVERRQSSEALPYEPIPWWREEPDGITGAPYLWLNFEGSDWGLRVKYMVIMPVPSALDLAVDDATNITAADTTITVDGAAATTLDDWPEPGWCKIDDEVISYTGIDTASETLTGCTRGVWGTAATHADDAVVYSVVPGWKPDVFGVVLSLAQVELYQMELHDAPAKERDASTFMVRWMGQQAEADLMVLRRFQPPRRWKLSPTAKTWAPAAVDNDWITPA